MCFAADAVPPISPVAGASITHERLTLTAGDGTNFAAFEATADGQATVGVVILPDVRGLFGFYEELALRFAEIGHDAVAIDYFGRTADMPPRPDDFAWKDHVPLTTFEGVRQDVAAAVAHLRSGDPERSIVTIGFCFGGSNSWHQAANGLGVSGAIGFYGNPVRRDVPQGAEPLTDRAQDMDCPVLGLMAGEDPGIPIEAADAFRSALAFAGVSHDIVVYPGAPHSFFDRASEQYAAESADAWKRVQAFIGSVA